MSDEADDDPCDWTDHDESWEQAAQTSREKDPEGIESLKLLRELQKDIEQ